MHVRAIVRSAATLALVSFLLSGCDAWPAEVLNKAGGDVRFRWHHKDYPDWSAWVSLKRGQSTRLAREHYVQDFVGVEVQEGGRSYTVSPAQLEDFRQTCRRNFTRLGDCEITYFGAGRFAVQRTSHGWVQDVN